MTATTPISRLKCITIKDCYILGAASILSFILETTLGLFLSAFIAVPLIGGIVSAWLDSFLIFLALFIVPRLGAPTLFATVLLVLSTVTPSFGPPGAYKILIGIGLGLIVDVLLLILGRSAAAYIASVAVGFAGSIPVTYVVWRYYLPKQADGLLSYIPMLTAIYGVISLIGALIGYWFFKNWLLKLVVVQRVRANEMTNR